MTDDQIQTLRKLADKFEYDNVYGESLRAAADLASRRCGNCGHTRDGEPKDGWIWCHEKSEHWRESDGCILGWVAKP